MRFTAITSPNTANDYAWFDRTGWANRGFRFHRNRNGYRKCYNFFRCFRALGHSGEDSGSGHDGQGLGSGHVRRGFGSGHEGQGFGSGHVGHSGHSSTGGAGDITGGAGGVTGGLGGVTGGAGGVTGGAGGVTGGAGETTGGISAQVRPPANG